MPDSFTIISLSKGQSMIALFSPSESKNFLHYKLTIHPPLIFDTLSFAGCNKTLREEVIDSYLHSLNDMDTARRLFGVKRLDNDVYQACQNLLTSPTIEALRLYDGVAYQALDVDNQEKRIKNLLFERVIIFSNLFGVLKGSDKIPFYRLKQGMFVDGFDFKSYYANFEKELDAWIGKEEVLDLRAEFYQKLYPIKTKHYIPMFYKDGKKLSHYAKMYRGHFLRQATREFLLSGKHGWDLLDFKFDGFELVGASEKDKSFILKYALH